MIACMTNFLSIVLHSNNNEMHLMRSIYSLFLYVDNPPQSKETTASLPAAMDIPTVTTSLRKIQSMCAHVGLLYSLILTI